MYVCMIYTYVYVCVDVPSLGNYYSSRLVKYKPFVDLFLFAYIRRTVCSLSGIVHFPQTPCHVSHMYVESAATRAK